MAEDRPIIQLEQVSCKIGYKYLLKDIDWAVYPGEHWAVFGMNGSGKTTLLSIVAGFKQYTSGKVRVFGQVPSNDNILAMRKRIGWVSASFFDKYYTKEAVIDVVLSGKYGTLGVQTDITAADRKHARALLTELCLTRQADYGFDMLSKGERQNVLIARALFTNPEILILDEPCTGLDVYHREYLFKTLEQLSQRKTLTVIYVTHYLEEIKPMFQKCLLLKQGHIFRNDDTARIFNADILSALLEQPVELVQMEQTQIAIKQVESGLVDLLREWGEVR